VKRVLSPVTGSGAPLADDGLPPETDDERRVTKDNEGGESLDNVAHGD
jgi:hypothetical protein